jgi:3-deoxy-manno-octulosonate cytidylyltransferase (CMP-KDO synthetase)
VKIFSHVLGNEQISTGTGGEAGIRTLGTLLGYSALAKRRFRPLSHLTLSLQAARLSRFRRSSRILKCQDGFRTCHAAKQDTRPLLGLALCGKAARPAAARKTRLASPCSILHSTCYKMTVAIIPARWGSTRFPGKPLFKIAGKPLIQHVWHRCQEAQCFDQIIVATDDMRIVEAVFAFGAEVSLTHPRHPSGTDRIAEIAKKLKKASVIFNVQGDEPLVDPKLLRKLTKKISNDKQIEMITAAVPAIDEEIRNEHAVKVVINTLGDALYFSRAHIPFRRSETALPTYKHLGIYGYRRKSLLKFVNMAPSELEKVEQLEQLRAIENGMKIRVVVSKSSSIGVDTPEDAKAVERILSQQGLLENR